jgi:hypothetical protein
MISAVSLLPAEVSMITRPPTRNSRTGPTISISSPCTVLTRPNTSTSSIASIAAMSDFT